MADNFRLRKGTSLPIFADGHEYWVIEEASTGKEVGKVPFVQFQSEATRKEYEDGKEIARVETMRLIDKMNG